MKLNLSSPLLKVVAGPRVRVHQADTLRLAGRPRAAGGLAVLQGQEVVRVAGTAAVGEHEAPASRRREVEPLQLTSARSGVRWLRAEAAGGLAVPEGVEVVGVTLTTSEGELSAGG